MGRGVNKKEKKNNHFNRGIPAALLHATAASPAQHYRKAARRPHSAGWTSPHASWTQGKFTIKSTEHGASKQVVRKLKWDLGFKMVD